MAERNTPKAEYVFAPRALSSITLVHNLDVSPSEVFEHHTLFDRLFPLKQNETWCLDPTLHELPSPNGLVQEQHNT